MYVDVYGNSIVDVDVDIERCGFLGYVYVDVERCVYRGGCVCMLKDVDVDDGVHVDVERCVCGCVCGCGCVCICGCVCGCV